MTWEQLIVELRNSVQGLEDIIENGKNRGFDYTVTDIEEEIAELEKTLIRFKIG